MKGSFDIKTEYVSDLNGDRQEVLTVTIVRDPEDVPIEMAPLWERTFFHTGRPEERVGSVFERTLMGALLDEANARRQ